MEDARAHDKALASYNIRESDLVAAESMLAALPEIMNQTKVAIGQRKVIEYGTRDRFGYVFDVDELAEYEIRVQTGLSSERSPIGQQPLAAMTVSRPTAVHRRLLLHVVHTVPC